MWEGSIDCGRRTISFVGCTTTSNYRSNRHHAGIGIGCIYQFSEATNLL